MIVSGANVGLYKFHLKSFPDAGYHFPVQTVRRLDYLRKVARFVVAQASATDFVYLSIYLNNSIFNS